MYSRTIWFGFFMKGEKMEYEVEITETMQRRVKINSSSVGEAIKKIKMMYKEEAIVLNELDFVDVEFKIIEGD